MDRDASSLKVKELELSARAHNVLSNHNFRTVKEIIDFGVDNIIAFPNAGKKTVEEIRRAIKPYLQKVEVKTEKRDFHAATINSMTNNEIYLLAPISELNLSVRALHALSTMKAKNIKDVVYILNSKLIDLIRKQNVGRMTVDEIKRATENYIFKAPQLARVKMNFTQAMNYLFSLINPKYHFSIKARFGYEDGTFWTLEKISKKLGVTRERIRQIIHKELLMLKNYKSRTALQALIENVERLLSRYGGVVSIDDVVTDDFFKSGNRNHCIFLFGFITELYHERYKLVDRLFLSSLTKEELTTIHLKIQEIVLRSRFPINKEDLISNILSVLGNISKNYLDYYLLNKARVEIANGNILSLGGLSIPQKIKILLRDIDKPMHFTEIAELYKRHFGDIKLMPSDLEHAIHARVSDSGDFMLVGPGTFISKDKFIRPANIGEFVKASREILRKLKNITDTKYLLNELKKRDIDVSTLNPYSLRAILLEYPDFVRYKKFEIGLEALADQLERKSHAELLYEILASSTKPMHIKDVWKEISKQRGLPLYAVDQRLAKDTRFIKVAPSTYTVAKNIEGYEEKRKNIIDFAREWIRLKGNAVSAFLVYEVLNQTDKVKDIFMGLVEHVLDISGEFVKLQNRFYDLAGENGQESSG